MSIVPVGDLVRRIRREFEDEPFEDYITSAFTADDTTVSVNSGSDWVEGDVGEFDDDTFEQFKVRIGGSGNLTVKPGHNDTESVDHADNCPVLKNPKLAGWQVVNVLEETAAELTPAFAWVVREVLLTPSVTQLYYTLPVDFLDLVSITQKQTGSSITSFARYGARDSALPVQVVDGLPVADVGSGKALYLYALDNATNALTVRYRALLTLSDVEDGLMATTLVLGACAKIALSMDSQVIRASIPQNAVSGLRQAVGYESRYADARRRLRSSLQRQGLGPMQQYKGN